MAGQPANATPRLGGAELLQEKLTIDPPKPFWQTVRVLNVSLTRLPADLEPLPVAPPEAGAAPISTGFVDEAAVLALAAGPRVARHAPPLDGLILSADENDFAGWMLPVETRRGPATPPAGRAAAPVPKAMEPGLDAPHHGGPRWWVAGLTGALCTMISSILLLSLAWRPAVAVEPAPARSSAPARIAAPAPAAPDPADGEIDATAAARP